MSTDVAVRGGVIATLDEKINYAKFLAHADLLPKAYQEKPANLLYAIEYGAMLGLPPMAAVVGIHIIDGRPTMSAGLMAAKVREAGHKIRVQSTGDGDQAKARCTITRADDPTFEYSAVWTMARAKQAGLLEKTNWRRHPVQMLKNRAISECCRDACQEVLLGVHYTPDELGAADDGGELVDDGHATLADGRIDQTKMSELEKDQAGLMTRTQRVEHEAMRRDGEPAPGAVDKRSEPDPDDPWLLPIPETPAAQSSSPVAAQPDTTAPHRTQAGKPALDRLSDLTEKVLGSWPEDDVTALYERVSGHAWTGAKADVQLVSSLLSDALKAAGNDPEQAAASLWRQVPPR
jgi:hypothetical protein